jgi:hypothetical protein
MKTIMKLRLRPLLGGIFFASFFISLLVSTAFAETWGKTYHGPWGDWWTGTTIRNFIVTSDGGYALVGSSNGYGVLLKLTGDNTVPWSKSFRLGFMEKNVTIQAVFTGGFATAGSNDEEAHVNNITQPAEGSEEGISEQD